MAEDADYTLADPFETEGLDAAGVGRDECFTLGVEWAAWRERLRVGRPFTDLCLANNARRLVRMAERRGRFVESRPAEDGWAFITVGGAKENT